MRVFKLPDLGEGLAEAEIVAWHVAPGDRVVADQPLVSIETDKAIVEVPSPQSGTLAKLCAEPGEIVKIGAPLVEFAEDGARADKGTVVGEIPAGEEAPAAAPERAPVETPEAGVRALPAVRRLAEELGVDLAPMSGSGPGGEITKADVEGAAPARAQGVSMEPLRGTRRAMARRMAAAHAEVVPASVMDDADIERWAPGADITIRLVRALAAACRAESALNAWYDGQAMARRLHERVDLGIATDTKDGLFVPVLRDIGKRDAADLRRGLDAMKADILARSIPPEELKGQTITLSNFGMIVGHYGVPVVIPPQVAIVGAGRIHRRPVAAGEEIALHRILPLTVTFDHRAVTGGEAGRFLKAMIEDLAQAE
jgi:pyruvate dehydrogenase E2 component (dihydrolipoamide acetyltransferase)